MTAKNKIKLYGCSVKAKTPCKKSPPKGEKNNKIITK